VKHKPPRICIVCHAKRLREPVTAADCLGFAACETCVLLDDQVAAAKAWSVWLKELHERLNETIECET
jgi:hypothetical protein